MAVNKYDLSLINKLVEKSLTNITSDLKNYNYSQLNLKEKIFNFMLHSVFLVILANAFPVVANTLNSWIPNEKNSIIESLQNELSEERFDKQKAEVVNKGLVQENEFLRQRVFSENSSLTNPPNTTNINLSQTQPSSSSPSSSNYISQIVLGLLGTGTCVFLLHIFGVVNVPAIQYSIEKMVELAQIANSSSHSQSQIILDSLNKSVKVLSENQNTELNKLEDILRIVKNISLGSRILSLNSKALKPGADSNTVTINADVKKILDMGTSTD